MSSEVEIERMVVRIIGDQSSLQSVAAQASETIDDLASSMDAGIKEIEESIKALDNAAEEVIPGVGDKLISLGEQVQELGGALSLYVTAPIMALGTFAVSQFSSMEDGMVALTSSVKSNGRAVQSTLADYSAFASQIQATTTMEDDAVLALLKTAESYQLTGESAKRAAKEAIALGAETGKGAEAMMRMTAAMASGDTKKAMMFARMIPQLRGVKDEAVFVAKYTHLVSAGFEKAEALAGTLSGQLKQLWNDFGDLNEEIGAVIAEGLKPIVAMMKDVVHWFQSFSPEMKRAIIYIGGLVAAIGPLVFGIGTLIIWIGFLTTAMATLGITSFEALGAMAIAFAPIAVVIGIIALAAVNIALYFSNAAEEAKRLKQEIDAAAEATRQLERAEAQANLPKDKGPITQQAMLDFADQEAGLKPIVEGGAFGATADADKMIEKMKDQIAVFEMTHREAEIYRLDMDGLSVAELQMVDALNKELTALEEKAKALKEATKEQEKAAQAIQKEKEHMESLGKSLKQQYMTPLEKAIEKQAELRKALEAETITNETFAQGMEAIGKEIDKVEGEHVATLKIGGMDSVAAGSAEAMQRIADFQSMSSGVKIPNIKGGDMPGMVANKQSDAKLIAELQHRWDDKKENKDAFLTAKGIDKLIEIGLAQLAKEGVELVAADLD